MFSQPRIEELFRKFATVRLYTDKVPAGATQVPDAREAREFRDEKFDNYALPYYVIVVPRGQTLLKIAAYEQGTIGSVEEFADFLNKALEKARREEPRTAAR